MKSKGVRLIRFAQVTAAASALAMLCWSAYETAYYLRTASRFQVQKLSVSGLKRVQEGQVLAKTGFDLGVNIFRVDLDEIRRRVEDVDWVRYASVQRVLPDEIIINVVERQPIGLARIQREIYQFDADAKILDPETIGGSSFPILDGLREGDHEGNVQKIEIYQRVLQALDQTALSELHITDSGEVTVVSASDPLLVNLGRTDFQARWMKYLQLKPQIQAQYPAAVRVDLRFKNQIIIKTNDDDAGEKIVWGGKKNTL